MSLKKTSTLLLMLSLAAPVHATIMTFTATGTVTSFYNYLDPADQLFPIAVGDHFMYTFSYDDKAIDWDAAPDSAIYTFSSLNPTLTINGYTYQFVPSPKSMSGIYVGNDDLNLGTGTYDDHLGTNVTEENYLRGGAKVSMWVAERSSTTGQGPMTTVSLPFEGVFDLTGFTERHFEFDYGIQRWHHYYDENGNPLPASWLEGFKEGFTGTIDSASVVATPLPGAFWLFLSGLAPFMRRAVRGRLQSRT